MKCNEIGMLADMLQGLHAAIYGLTNQLPELCIATRTKVARKRQLDYCRSAIQPNRIHSLRGYGE